MSAEVGLLREAATQMRERAIAASGGRWSAGDESESGFLFNYGDFGWYVTGPAGSPEFEDSEQGQADARHVASWDGPPALAVAELLTRAANQYETEWDDVACADDCPEGCAGHGQAEFHVVCNVPADECPCLAPFMVVARGVPTPRDGVGPVSTMTEPRTWTITVVPPCAWLTGNIERYRYQRSSLVRQWREATVVACKAAKLPHGVSDVELKGTVYYVGRRPVRDRLNLANTFKAIVDALTPHKVKWRDGKPVVSVGYGFLPDDDDRHVRSTTWDLAPAKTARRSTPAVVLTIREVA